MALLSTLKNSPFPQEVKDLAAAYRMLALLNLDDMMGGHLSVKSTDNQGFWIPPFGYLFEEVKASHMKKVLFATLKDPEINPTALVLHRIIYTHQPETRAIFHLHTEATVAVASTKGGLKPLSQWAMLFNPLIAYCPYDGLALDYSTQVENFATSLENKKILMLENHGVIVCGDSIEEAFFLIFNLEKACRLQVSLAGVENDQLILPKHDVQILSHKQLQNDLKGKDGMSLAKLAFQAMLRKLDRLGIDYND